MASTRKGSAKKTSATKPSKPRQGASRPKIKVVIKENGLVIRIGGVEYSLSDFTDIHAQLGLLIDLGTLANDPNRDEKLAALKSFIELACDSIDYVAVAVQHKPK